MGTLSEWAANLCFAAVGCALIGFVLPKGNAEKTARALLGLFMVWVIFSPLSVWLAKRSAERTDFDFEYSAEADASAAVADYMREQTEYTVKQILRDNQISCSDVRVSCHIEENGVININGIEIVCKGESEKIKELIERETGLVPEVTIE